MAIQPASLCPRLQPILRASGMYNMKYSSAEPPRLPHCDPAKASRKSVMVVIRALDLLSPFRRRSEAVNIMQVIDTRSMKKLSAYVFSRSVDIPDSFGRYCSILSLSELFLSTCRDDSNSQCERGPRILL